MALAALPTRAAGFTAALDREVITLGESATLALKFEGGEPKTMPMPAAVPNLQITYVGPSRRFIFDNGQTSSTTTYNFTVSTSQFGDYTIPAMTVEVGGQRMTSLPLKLTVLKPNAPPPDATNAATQLAFLRLVLPKKEVYVGEILTAELQFYFRQGVRLAEQPQLTALPVEGFTVGKIAAGQERQVRIGSAIYTVLPAAVALTVLKTGPLSIGPVTANVPIQVPSNARRPRSIWDMPDLEEMMERLGGGRRTQIPVAAGAEGLHSLPLPTNNVPRSFTGAVGNYTLSFSAGPTNVTVGDPITVKVQLSGRGAPDALVLPDQTAWKDFSSYPPKTEVKTSDPLGLQGAKFFEQVLVPQNAGIKELPTLEFTFFDPDQKAYRTLKQPAIPLTVRPGGAVPAPVIAAGKSGTPEAPPPTQDIVGLKQHLGTVAMAQPPLVLRSWFLGAQAVPVLAWLAAVGWRKRAEALARNPRLRRRKQVAQIVNDGLEQLRQFAADNKPDEFFATLFRLLQEQIGERLDLPASSITEAIVDERLKPAGLAETAYAALHELFQTCNLARFAPVQTSQELAALVPRVEAVILQLRKFEA